MNTVTTNTVNIEITRETALKLYDAFMSDHKSHGGHLYDYAFSEDWSIDEEKIRHLKLHGWLPETFDYKK